MFDLPYLLMLAGVIVLFVMLVLVFNHFTKRERRLFVVGSESRFPYLAAEQRLTTGEVSTSCGSVYGLYYAHDDRATTIPLLPGDQVVVARTGNVYEKLDNRMHLVLVSNYEVARFWTDPETTAISMLHEGAWTPVQFVTRHVNDTIALFKDSQLVVEADKDKRYLRNGCSREGGLP